VNGTPALLPDPFGSFSVAIETSPDGSHQTGVVTGTFGQQVAIWLDGGNPIIPTDETGFSLLGRGEGITDSGFTVMDSIFDVAYGWYPEMATDFAVADDMALPLSTIFPDANWENVVGAGDVFAADGFLTILGDGSTHFTVVPDPTVQVRTLLSDLTNNGFVDFQDLTILLANWNKEVTAAEGNLVNADTTAVDFADLTTLLADWTGPGPAGSPEAALGEAVLEPSSLLLALLATLGVSCGWRRRRRAA
jgi:hypothetical protein